jgi:hypothetical protein
MAKQQSAPAGWAAFPVVQLVVDDLQRSRRVPWPNDAEHVVDKTFRRSLLREFVADEGSHSRVSFPKSWRHI